MRPPFNVTSLSLKAAVTALEDKEFVEKTIKNNFSEMKKYEKFAKENQISFIDSYTNFITFTFDDKKNSKEIAQILLKKGIIIRDLTSYGINGIRVTIGTPKQNDIFLKAFKEVL
jgi:histidinol-phosphate aminotransferase